MTTGSSKRTQTPAAAISVGTGVEGGDDAGTLKEQYDAGLGNSAVSKLAAKEERPAAMIHARLTELLQPELVDERSVQDLWRDVQARMEGWTAPDVCWLIEDRWPKAKKTARTNRLMFLLTAVRNHLSAKALYTVRRQREGARQQEQRAQERYAEQSEAAARERALLYRLDAVWQEIGEAERGKRSLAWITANKASENGWHKLTAQQKQLRAETGARRQLLEEIELEGQ